MHGTQHCKSFTTYSLVVSLFPADFDQKHGISAAWSRDARGQGVTIAVLDTAIDPAHPDLHGAVECLDFAGDAIPRLDGHGTHIASLIRRMAPECRVIGMNIFPKESKIQYNASVRAAAAEALQHCIARWPEIRIVNMSFAIPRGKFFRCREGNRCALCNKVNEAKDVGIMPVVAAGNTGPAQDTIECPGCAEGATTIAAILSSKDQALYDERPEDRKIFGTSFSAAYHSGAAAMLISAMPEASADEINVAIARSAGTLPSGMPGRPNYAIALAHLIGVDQPSVDIFLERIQEFAKAAQLPLADSKKLRAAIEMILVHINRGLLRKGEKAKAKEIIDSVDKVIVWDSFPEFAAEAESLRDRTRS